MCLARSLFLAKVFKQIEHRKGFESCNVEWERLKLLLSKNVVLFNVILELRAFSKRHVTINTFERFFSSMDHAMPSQMS